MLAQNNLYSILFYITVIFICIILAYLSTKVKSKINFPLILLVAVLTFVSGLRNRTVGTDTNQYMIHFERWKLNLTGNLFEFEPGLYYLGKLILFFGDPQLLLSVTGLIINGLIIIRLWSLRKNINFTLSTSLYLIVYFIITLSGVRQWISISIVFFGISYLLEYKYFKFYLLIIIAVFFHNTAIIALIIPFFDSIANKFKLRVHSYLFIIYLILSPVIILITYIVFKRYDIYFTNISIDGFGFLIWIKIFFIIAIIILVQKHNFEDLEHYILYKRVLLIYLLGLFVSLPGYYIDNLARAGYYLTIFEIILFPILLKYKNSNLIFMILLFYIVLNVSIFLLEMITGSRGQIPYLFYWEV